MQVFQITQDDIDRSSTLNQEDLYKWCFTLYGCIQGFYTTESEASLAVKALKTK